MRVSGVRPFEMRRGNHFQLGSAPIRYGLQNQRCKRNQSGPDAVLQAISVSVLKRTFFPFYASSEEPEMDFVSHPDPKRTEPFLRTVERP